MLSVRNDRMRVVYAHFENRHAPSIAAAAVCHALAMDVSTLILYDERAGQERLWVALSLLVQTDVPVFLSKAFAGLP
jgi:hypothetical protein